MQLEKRTEWNYGNYTLTKQELLPELKNEIRHVSLRLSELIESVKNLPFCEVRELPNWKLPVHIIIDPQAQKLFEKFHRYGTNPDFKTDENQCPFQGGVLRERFTALVGADNLISNYEETSKAQRKNLQLFFTKHKLNELEPIWKRITQDWLTIQMNQPQVQLFDAVLRLSCQCLIQGIMGYNACNEADINLNTSFWKKLLHPTTSEQNSVIDYEYEGEPNILRKAWNLYQDSSEIAQKLHTYYLKSTEIDQLTLKIYKATVIIKGTMSQHLHAAGYEEKMILENLKGLLIAGQETVGYLLGFILYQYSKDPFMQDNHAYKRENIKKAYLESLRLYSVAGVQREASSDMVLKYGLNAQNLKEHYIRKGDRIVCIPVLSGHNSNEWDDPETFNSERDNLEDVKKNPHFGGGAHSCIGKDAAELEILTILEEILTNANVTTLELLPELLNSFTLRPIHDIPVTFSSNFLNRIF